MSHLFLIYTLLHEIAWIMIYTHTSILHYSIYLQRKIDSETSWDNHLIAEPAIFEYAE